MITPSPFISKDFQCTVAGDDVVVVVGGATGGGCWVVVVAVKGDVVLVVDVP